MTASGCQASSIDQHDGVLPSNASIVGTTSNRSIANRVDHLHVHHRVGTLPSLEPGERALLWERAGRRGQVADRASAAESAERVGEPGRRAIQQTSQARRPAVHQAPSRSMMFGGVRTVSHVSAAPPVARSCAISIPDDPEPITSTRFRAYGLGLRYSDECSTSPSKTSLRIPAGMLGTFWFPVATITWRACMSPRRCAKMPAARLRIDPGDMRFSFAGRSRARASGARGGRSPDRVTGTSVCLSDTAGREGARTADPC